MKYYIFKYKMPSHIDYLKFIIYQLYQRKIYTAYNKQNIETKLVPTSLNLSQSLCLSKINTKKAIDPFQLLNVPPESIIYVI